MGTRKRLSLLLAAAALILCGVWTLHRGVSVPAEDYEAKRRAAQIMDDCMAQIRAYRAELGLALNPGDLHQTGMIGLDYSGITTTLGALDAKRTTASSDMAALLVQLLSEAGVQPGDTVGAGFSGSFPAMDLAVLAACDAMGVQIIYIPSVGSSTYGANQPELTFPDMAARLAADGLLSTPAAAFSLGGELDCGLDMDGTLTAEIAARLERRGIPLLYIEDYEANVEARMEIFGGIACFIGVGGNLTTSGRGENTLSWGVIPPYTVTKTDEGSGLLERYNAAGLPVIHILNIKRLVADYGLAYDPAALPEIGASAIYHDIRRPALPAALGLLAAAGALAWGFLPHRKQEGTP